MKQKLKLEVMRELNRKVEEKNLSDKTNYGILLIDGITEYSDISIHTDDIKV